MFFECKHQHVEHPRTAQRASPSDDHAAKLRNLARASRPAWQMQARQDTPGRAEPSSPESHVAVEAAPPHDAHKNLTFTRGAAGIVLRAFQTGCDFVFSVEDLRRLTKAKTGKAAKRATLKSYAVELLRRGTIEYLGDGDYALKDKS
jgi:hypothetical protein